MMATHNFEDFLEESSSSKAHVGEKCLRKNYCCTEDKECCDHAKKGGAGAICLKGKCTGFRGDNCDPDLRTVWEGPLYTRWVNLGNYNYGVSNLRCRGEPACIKRLYQHPLCTRCDIIGLKKRHAQLVASGQLDSAAGVCNEAIGAGVWHVCSCKCNPGFTGRNCEIHKKCGFDDAMMCSGGHGHETGGFRQRTFKAGVLGVLVNKDQAKGMRDPRRSGDAGYELCYCQCEMGYFGANCQVHITDLLTTLASLNLWGLAEEARLGAKTLEHTVLGGVPEATVLPLAALRDELVAKRKRDSALRTAHWELDRADKVFAKVDHRMIGKYAVRLEAAEVMAQAVSAAHAALQKKSDVAGLQRAADQIQHAVTFKGFMWTAPESLAQQLDDRILLALEEHRLKKEAAAEAAKRLASKKGKPVTGQRPASSAKVNSKTSAQAVAPTDAAPGADGKQTVASVAAQLAKAGFSAYMNTQTGGGTVSAHAMQQQVDPIVDLTTGFLADLVGLSDVELPGAKISTHVPDTTDYEGGDDQVFVMARTKPGAEILGGLVESAALLVAHGKWEDDTEETVVTLCASFHEPVAMMKKAFGGLDPSELFPSLRHVDMGFVVSTADHDLPDEALPADVDMPGLFGARDGFSRNPAFVGVYKLKENDVRCAGVDFLCTFFKGIADTLGDPTIELEVGEGALTLGISTGEIWFDNAIGMDAVEFVIEAGEDGLVLEMGVTLLVCAAGCDSGNVADKDVLRFVGAVAIELGKEVIVRPDLQMVGFYTFPAPMDFLSVGELAFGASLSFATFPPLPNSFRTGGAVCLSRNKQSGRGGCHVEGGWIENKEYDCTSVAAPCIAGAVQFGMDKSDPEGTYIYTKVDGVSIRNILYIAGMDDVDGTIPPELTSLTLEESTLSYAPAGLAPDNPVVTELGIEIPDGFSVHGTVSFMGTTASLSMATDGEYFEGEMSLDAVELPGNLLSIRRGPQKDGEGMFMKVYAGWVPSTMWGNGDWCQAAFCASGAGYAEIPLLGAKGGVAFDMSFGANCGATEGTCGTKYSYELRDMSLFWGGLQADAFLTTEVNAENPLASTFHAKLSVRTDDLYLKLIQGVMGLVKPIYDGITKLIQGVQYLLDQAESFIEEFKAPIAGAFNDAATSIGGVYSAMKAPFDDAMHELRKIEGCNPSRVFIQERIEPKYHADFVALVQEWDGEHGFPRWEPDLPYTAKEKDQLLKHLVSSEEAHTFLQVQERHKLYTRHQLQAHGFFGEIIPEGVKEAARRVAEFGREAAETAREAVLFAACKVANGVLIVASTPLLPVYAVWKLMAGLAWAVDNINPAKVVNDLLDKAQAKIDQVFSVVLDAMRSASESEVLANLAAKLESVFSLQELDAEAELGPDKTHLGFSIVVTILGKLMGFDVSLTLQGNPIDALIQAVVMDHIVPAMFSGVQALKQWADETFGAVVELFQKGLTACKDVLEEVQAWIDDVGSLL